MAVSINAREVALSNTAPRSSQASVGIGANSAVFIKPATGNTTPSSISLVATVQGYSTPTYTWSYALNTAPDTWIGFGSSVSTQNITNTAFETALGTASAITYRCVVTESLRATTTAYYTVDYTKEGVQGTNLVAELTNDYCAVPTDSAGNNGVFTGAETTLEVYLNGVKQTTGFTYYVSALSAVTYRDADDATDQSDVGEGSAPISAFPVSIKSLSADAGYIDITAKRTSDSTLLTKRFTLAKNKSGTPGVTPAYYYVVASVSVISKASPDAATDGIHTPSSVVFTPYKVVGNAAPVIATDAFFTLWNSPGSEAGTASTVTAASTVTILSTDDITAVNYRLYTSAAKTTLLDSETVPVVFKGATGADSTVPGPAGNKSITLTAFKWSTSAQTAPTQAATLTWSGFGVSAYPTGWTSSAPASTTNGETLYQLNVVITAAGDAVTTAFNWSSGTVGRVGFRQDGTIGLTGSSARTAYAVTTSGTAPTPIAAGTGDSVPITSGVTWSFTATSVLTAGQYMYQVDGVYNPNTNVTAWGVAYLSNLKVGSLSAISVDTGNLTVGTSGSIKNFGGGYNSSGFFLGYDSTAYKFSVGNGTNNLTFDGSTLSIPAARVTGTLTASQIVVSNKGSAINDDPMFEDPTAWSYPTPVSFSSNTSASGAVGNTFITCSSGTNNIVYAAKKYAVGPGKRYRLSANLYAAAGNDRDMYLFVQFYDSVGAAVSSALTGWGGTLSGYTYGGLTPTDVFTRQGSQFGEGTGRPIPANVRSAEIGVWFQYSGSGSSSVVQACQDLRLEELVGADLIVDGAITAGKISVANLAAINANMGAITAGSISIGGAGGSAVIASNGAASFTGVTVKSLDGLTTLFQAGATPATSTLYIPGTVNNTPGGWVNSNITVNANGSLNNAGAGSVTIGGLGYTGSLDATSDLKLNVRGTGLVLKGNSCDRPTGGGGWDADCYSSDSYTGGAYCSFVPSQGTSSYFMAGLNTDPLGNQSYSTLDYAFYMYGTSDLRVYESAADRGSVGTYAAGDVLSVTYDGVNVRYMQNGTVLRTVAATASLKLYFDSSIVYYGLSNIRFGPLSSNNWADTGGTGKPQDNATVGATWGTNITSQPTNLAGINSTEGTKLGGIAAGANNTSVDSSGNIQGVSSGAGSSVANNRSSIIDAPEGAIFISSSPNLNGAIQIRLPIQVNVHYTMFKMNVEIYEYVQGLSCTLAISGHTSGTGWYNVTANLIGGNVEYPVRYGHDGTYFVIWIGDTGEVWQYPQVFVRNFVAGYSSYQASVWSTGWVISLTTSAPTNVSQTVTDTYPPADWSKTARRPTSLSGINSTEGTKLGGIETGATVGAPTGTNVGGVAATSVASASNGYNGQVKSLYVAGSQTSFYPVYINSTGVAGSGASMYYDVVVSRPNVHEDSTWLGSYVCHIFARATAWGSAPGSIIEVDQVTGYGTYTSGVAEVNVGSAGGGIWVLLRGGMTHTISVSQPIGAYTATAYATGQTEANSNSIPVVTTGTLLNYLNKAYCPSAPVDFNASIGGAEKPANNATVGATAGTNLKDSTNTVLSDNEVKNNSSIGGAITIANPYPGILNVGSSGVAGAFWLILPQGWNNSMIKLTIDIYEHRPGGSTQVYEVGGYTHSTANWYNTYASYTGAPASKRRVAFGNDGPSGRPMIGIGLFTGSWEYPKITIKNLIVGHSGPTVAQWQTDWSLSFQTSRSYTEHDAVANPVPGGQFSGIDVLNTGNVATYIAPTTLNSSLIVNGAITADKISIGTARSGPVLNPGFEDFATSDSTLPARWARNQVWGGNSSTAYRNTNSTYIKSGGASLVLNPGAGGSADMFAYTVPVSPGERWYYSAWVRSFGTNAGTSLGFFMRYRGGATEGSIGMEEYPGPENVSVPTTWTKYEYVVTIPAGMYWACPMFLNYQTNSGHLIAIDEVEFKRVDSVRNINDSVNGGATTGRVEIDATSGGRIRIYDASNNVRVKIGYLL